MAIPPDKSKATVTMSATATPEAGAYSTTGRIKRIIADNLGHNARDIDEADSLEDLGADSLDKIAIIGELQKEFRFDIPDDDSHELNTVAKIIQYIERNDPMAGSDSE